MSFGTRLRQRREALGLKQSVRGALLGVTGAAIGNYENGVSSPRSEALRRAFRALECDANYLFQDEMDEVATYSPSEHEMMQKYRALDEHGKRMIDMTLDEETRRLEAERTAPAAPAKIIPLYATPAAAGYVSPAYGDDYENYEVPASSPADFAVRISGDSMEPVIADGSVALVKRQLDLQPGDVGLFFVDGSMKCKQYFEDNFGNIYLFSLNRARADADVTIRATSGVTVLCYGKVILNKRPPLPEVR